MVLDISVTESYGRTYYSSQRLFLKTAMFNFPHDGNTCCKPGNSMLLFFYTVDHVCAVKYLGPLHVGSKPGILMIHMHTIKYKVKLALSFPTNKFHKRII